MVLKPVLAGISRQLYLPRLEQARLLMADGTRSGSAPQCLWFRFALGATVRGRTSRLVREMEEQQLVQAISNFFRWDESLFTIVALLDPQQLGVESLICAQLVSCRIHWFTRGTCPLYETSSVNDYAFSAETPNQLTGLYGYHNTPRSAISIHHPDQIQSFKPKNSKFGAAISTRHTYAITVLKPC